jgi:hypothetical protein
MEDGPPKTISTIGVGDRLSGGGKVYGTMVFTTKRNPLFKLSYTDHNKQETTVVYVSGSQKFQDPLTSKWCNIIDVPAHETSKGYTLSCERDIRRPDLLVYDLDCENHRIQIGLLTFCDFDEYDENDLPIINTMELDYLNSL